MHIVDEVIHLKTKNKNAIENRKTTFLVGGVINHLPIFRCTRNVTNKIGSLFML